jgi:hypothetical protein
LTTSTFIKWSGFALIAWALHLLVRDYTFAFTHGSTEAAMGRTFLGLDVIQYGLVWPAFAPLALVGLVGLYLRVSPGLGRSGKTGLVIAFLGVALWFIANVIQFWMLDTVKQFYSPMMLGGWVLSLVSYLVLATGLVVAGIEIQRAQALPGGSVVLAAGILLLPTVVLVGYLVQHNDGSLPWQLLYGSLSVPYDLCWLRLGFILTTDLPEDGNLELVGAVEDVGVHRPTGSPRGPGR